MSGDGKPKNGQGPAVAGDRGKSTWAGRADKPRHKNATQGHKISLKMQGRVLGCDDD